MLKLFPGLPGYLGRLMINFGSGRDACFIVATAVPVLEFALLFVIDFPYIVCYFFRKFWSARRNFFTKESSSCNVHNCCLSLQYYWYFYLNRIFTKSIWHWILIQILGIVVSYSTRKITYARNGTYFGSDNYSQLWLYH